MSPELADVVLKLQPDLGGLVVGKLGKQFVPVLAGAGLFAAHSAHSVHNKYYIKVSDIAEKLVLYGRDIMGDSIVAASPEVAENELVIILNPAGEAVGIGRTRFSGSSIMQKGKITISTLADLGSYLRDESREEARVKLRTVASRPRLEQV
jgi:60S ribosome subunit biogenesis protein NIP7